MIFQINKLNFTNLVVYQSIKKFFFDWMEEEQYDFMLSICKEAMVMISEMDMLIKHF